MQSMHAAICVPPAGCHRRAQHSQMSKPPEPMQAEVDRAAVQGMRSTSVLVQCGIQGVSLNRHGTPAAATAATRALRATDIDGAFMWRRADVHGKLPGGPVQLQAGRPAVGRSATWTAARTVPGVQRCAGRGMRFTRVGPSGQDRDGGTAIGTVSSVASEPLGTSVRIKQLALPDSNEYGRSRSPSLPGGRCHPRSTLMARERRVQFGSPWGRCFVARPNSNPARMDRRSGVRPYVWRRRRSRP